MRTVRRRTSTPIIGVVCVVMYGVVVVIVARQMAGYARPLGYETPALLMGCVLGAVVAAAYLLWWYRQVREERRLLERGVVTQALLVNFIPCGRCCDYEYRDGEGKAHRRRIATPSEAIEAIMHGQTAPTVAVIYDPSQPERHLRIDDDILYHVFEDPGLSAGKQATASLSH